MSGLSVNVAVKDEALRRALREVTRDARRDATAATKRAVREVMAPAAKARVPSKSGRYRASIRAGATARSAYVQARTAYARVLERGRSPMRITVKRAGALSTPAGPRHHVNSPRYPERRTLERAVLPSVGETSRRIEQYVIDALKRHGL